MSKRTNVVLILSLFMILMCVTYAPADDRRPAADTRPLIFINTNSNVGWHVAVNTGMSIFKDYAEEIGFRVNHGLHTSITDEKLDGVSIYILIHPAFFPTAEDKEALKRFMRKGGTVICFPWQTEPNTLPGFLKEFGIDTGQFIYHGTLVAMNGTVPASSLLYGPNPVTEGLVTRAYRELVITDPTHVTSLADWDGGEKNTILSKHPNIGSGKLIVFGCLSIVCNASVGGDIERDGNAAFVKNLLRWLYPSCDLSVGKFKWKGAYPGPGDTITTVVVVKNIGKNPNTNLWMQYSLLQENGAGGAATAVYYWSQLNAMVVVEPGKKVQLKHALKIPLNAPAGEYILRVTIDNKEVEPDTNRANNVSDAKKILIVQ